MGFEPGVVSCPCGESFDPVLGAGAVEGEQDGGPVTEPVPPVQFGFGPLPGDGWPVVAVGEVVDEFVDERRDGLGASVGFDEPLPADELAGLLGEDVEYGVGAQVLA